MVSKPNKPDNIISRSFGGTKNDFSSTLIENGYQENVKQKLQGDNLNYLLDSLGGELEYIRTIVDYLRDLPTNTVPYISGNTMISATINTLLPSQSGNSGKYLTTNGSACSWANNFIKIGDPQFTLNFNQTLPDDCIWLEGQDFAIPVSGDDMWQLYQIYGNTYNKGNANRFYLPDFRDKTIWGGTIGGYIEAGLPNITGTFPIGSGTTSASITGAFTKVESASLPGEGGGAGHDKKGYFDASLEGQHSIYGKSDTVQPPAIKVRVYTRYK